MTPRRATKMNKRASNTDGAKQQKKYQNDHERKRNLAVAVAVAVAEVSEKSQKP